MPNTHNIVPVHLAVQAMRDNGYKDAACAIAELIDNSIQAKATKVELLCLEDGMQLDHRRRYRIKQVAVLDNGKGMCENILRLSLQFGNGSYLERKKHTGMGRFGMGLPCSSMSQCKRVDVWSWQSGPDTAIHSYLDLDEICTGKLSEVPEPSPKEIPSLWRDVGQEFGKSGTLVIWSNLDRCRWRTARSIIENSELVIGRMYRKFLNRGKVQIRMAAFQEDNPGNFIVDELALPNDPNYLMERTSCPKPFDDKAMFNRWGEEDNYEASFIIDYMEQRHTVTVRYSIAKEEARPSGNPGSKPHGQHANRNVGVSILRAGRELNLDDSWRIKYEPTERWWGVEIEFPPSLDDLFGVTNNKQAAHNFTELANINFTDLLKGGKSIQELMDKWQDVGDPRAPLLEIAQQITSNLGTLRGLLKAQTKGERSTKRHAGSTAEDVATEATKERQGEGHVGDSDKDEGMEDSEKKKQLEEFLLGEGVMETTASEMVTATLVGQRKYMFAVADLETPAFFSVKPKGGVLIISLNSNHPAYEKLMQVLEGEEEEEVETDSNKELRLKKALDGLKLLLTAWARYEDETPDGKLKEGVQDARTNWGRIARNFLREE